MSCIFYIKKKKVLNWSLICKCFVGAGFRFYPCGRSQGPASPNALNPRPLTSPPNPWGMGPTLAPALYLVLRPGRSGQYSELSTFQGKRPMLEAAEAEESWVWVLTRSSLKMPQDIVQGSDCRERSPRENPHQGRAGGWAASLLEIPEFFWVGAFLSSYQCSHHTTSSAPYGLCEAGLVPSPFPHSNLSASPKGAPVLI